MTNAVSHRKHQHTQGAGSGAACKSFAKMAKKCTFQDPRIPGINRHKGLDFIRTPPSDHRLPFRAMSTLAATPTEFQLCSTKRKGLSHIGRDGLRYSSSPWSNPHWEPRFIRKIPSLEDLGEKSHRHLRNAQSHAKQAQKRHNLERKARLARNRRHHRHEMRLELRLAFVEREEVQEDDRLATAGNCDTGGILELDDDIEIVDGFNELIQSHLDVDRTIAALTFAIANGAGGLEDRPHDFGGLLDVVPSTQPEAGGFAGDLWH